jgi:MYXO-CTERM domain-containing protein
MRLSFASLVSVFVLALALPASAQRTVAYDTVSEGTPAAVTCGFCAMEKFGTVFYSLGTPGGLEADEFPFTLTAVQVAIARTRVVGDILSGYTCQGSDMGGTVNFTIEVYAGETVPMSIMALPTTGPWAGETLVYEASDVPLETSVATMDGGNMFNVMINEFALPDGGVMVEAPNTYLRVVFTIPGGGGSSASCTDLGLTPPAAVSIRDDDGRIAARRSLILATDVDLGGIGIPGGWYWNEDVPDMLGGGTGVNGDWAIRIKIQPMSMSGSDGGVGRDGGPSAGSDGGPGGDGGMSGGMCTTSSECAGGEVCEGGFCVRTACTTTAECGGGRTCVDGRCRNLCDTDSECAGGEVCDTGAGVCRDANEGGCGCRVAARTKGTPVALLGLGLLAAIAIRRRTRR